MNKVDLNKVDARDAYNKGTATTVRSAKAVLSIQAMNDIVAHNQAIQQTIKKEDIVKGSAYHDAVRTTRDVHKEAYGYRGDIIVAHRYCVDAEDYKAAYVEAWCELAITAEEALEAQQAADKAAWEEHRKAIEAGGYIGTNLEQLMDYCMDTIPSIAAHPDDFFTETGLTGCGGLEWALRCSSQRSTILEWINS